MALKIGRLVLVLVLMMAVPSTMSAQHHHGSGGHYSDHGPWNAESSIGVSIIPRGVLVETATPTGFGGSEGKQL